MDKGFANIELGEQVNKRAGGGRFADLFNPFASGRLLRVAVGLIPGGPLLGLILR